MKASMDTCSVIATLHHIGFTDDFVFHGTDILWVQKKMYLHTDKFTLVEYHRFADARGREAIIYGVIALCHNAMGILIKHYNDCTAKYTTMIEGKIEAFFPYATE